MLHIFLLILKIIGYLILGILALVLILVLFFLLSPFVYQADAAVDNSFDSLTGKIRFHWLMHLVSGEVSYREGTFTWRFRAAWKTYGSDMETEDPNEPAEPSADKAPETYPQDSAVKKEEKAEQKRSSNAEKEPVPMAAPAEKTADSPTKEKLSFFGKLYARCKAVLEKIEYTFRKFCDNIKALGKKKERLSSFLNNEIHKAAFHRTVRELKRFLVFLKPDRASVDVEFGFEDPSHTGYTLAGISMIYPVIGEYTRIRPDFENKVFRADADIKGKVRVLYALVFAWNMVWDKNVRTTYRHLRRFRL